MSIFFPYQNRSFSLTQLIYSLASNPFDCSVISKSSVFHARIDTMDSSSYPSVFMAGLFTLQWHPSGLHTPGDNASSFSRRSVSNEQHKVHYTSGTAFHSISCTFFVMEVSAPIVHSKSTGARFVEFGAWSGGSHRSTSLCSIPAEMNFRMDHDITLRWSASNFFSLRFLGSR